MPALATELSLTLGGDIILIVYPVEIALPFTVAFGLIVGSYLNVVVYRLPRGISTVRPASRCPRCVMPIRAFDNVPVLGYLWLFARCRDCRMPISPRYPLVEAAAGGWFAFVFFRSGFLLEQVAACLFGAFLIVIALIDFDHQRLPVWPTVAVGLAGLFFQPWLGWAGEGMSAASPMTWALFAAAAGGLGAVIASAVGRRVGIPEGLAAGDALALFMIGAVLGPRGLLVSFLLASAAVLLVYTPRLLTKSRRPETPIPFVTFLAFGAVISLAAGPLSSLP